MAGLWSVSEFMLGCFILRFIAVKISIHLLLDTITDPSMEGSAGGSCLTGVVIMLLCMC